MVDGNSAASKLVRCYRLVDSIVFSIYATRPLQGRAPIRCSNSHVPSLCFNLDLSLQTDANNLRNPENFPVQSLVNAAFTDADTTFYLLGAPSGGSELYTEDWKLTGTEQLVRLAVENGICDSCLESGTVESGFEIELMGMVMNLYPPTLDIRDIMIRNPDVSPCR